MKKESIKEVWYTIPCRHSEEVYYIWWANKNMFYQKREIRKTINRSARIYGLRWTRRTVGEMFKVKIVFGIKLHITFIPLKKLLWSDKAIQAVSFLQFGIFKCDDMSLYLNILCALLQINKNKHLQRIHIYNATFKTPQFSSNYRINSQGRADRWFVY